MRNELNELEAMTITASNAGEINYRAHRLAILAGDASTYSPCEEHHELYRRLRAVANKALELC